MSDTILRPTKAVSTEITLLLALACGVIVANIYYVQPLAGPIGKALAPFLKAMG